MNCVRRGRCDPLNPCTCRLAARLCGCMTPAQSAYAKEAAFKIQNFPPANHFVDAVTVHTIFQTYYGANWLKYFKAWKGNFGYTLVNDNGTAGASTRYSVTGQFWQDLANCAVVPNPALGVPYGCVCQIQGCPGCPDGFPT